MSYYYQPKASQLDRHVRRMTVALIQGYDEMQEKLADLVQTSKSQDGQPRGGGIGDPTFQAVERRTGTPEARAIRSIDEALLDIPEEYRKVVMEWTKSGRPLYAIIGSEVAHMNTWSRQRERLIEGTAMRMGWTEENA